jgi:hypothetical protein
VLRTLSGELQQHMQNALNMFITSHIMLHR